MDTKTAVVLFNLGGPDSLEAVRPFLYNLFSDPDIFHLPLGFLTQKPFAALVSRRRAPEARRNYAAIGGRSPLLERTQEQAIALQLALAEEGAPYDAYVCMRYWHPRAREVVAQLKAKGYERVILLPLYPQYSRTTTGSSYNEFLRECRRARYRPRTTLIHHWHGQPEYHQAIAETIEAEREKFNDPRPEAIALLFSAHGLPQKLVDAGDPYAQHIQETVEAVSRRLGWPDVSLCFQSRVGPLEWLKPYTADVIRQKAEAGVQQILVYPVAFVSDHVETLYELGMEYATLAREAGIREYRVAPALNDHPLLIETLKYFVLHVDDDT